MSASSAECTRATPKSVARVRQLLLKQHGHPDNRTPSYPIDELVATILSQNTTDVNSGRAFASLKRDFPTWEVALKAKPEAIAKAIHCGGLAQIKSVRIIRVLRAIVEKERKLSLDRIKSLPIPEALAYLTDLDGVGIKTACCVLLFAWNKPVMPVDTHVFRLTQRLGWLPESVSIEKAHEELHKLIAAEDRGMMHLLFIRHGRVICRALRPACSGCMLSRQCPSSKLD